MGRGVLVTRPEPGAAETAERLRALGWQPILAPALVLEPRSLAPPRAQALLLTSRAAARALAPGPKLPADLPVLAVGAATAAEATARGFTAVTAAEGDAAALARLAAAQLKPSGLPLLLAVGEGYGQDLATALREAGFRVVRRVAYAAAPARTLLEAAAAALRDEGSVSFALFTSPRSAECAISLLREAGLAGSVGSVVACAISPRVAEALAPLPWREVRVAVRPDQDALLSLLGPDRRNTMSDAPETPKPLAAPVERNSPISPAAGFRLDPAALAIGIGGLVLLAAVWWLLTTPRKTAEGGRLDQVETRLGGLEALRQETGTLGGKLDALGNGLEARLKALEGKPALPTVDLKPLEAQLAALAERAASAERQVAQARDMLAAAERRLASVEGRPVVDPATVTPRPEFTALGGKVQEAGEQLAALGGRVQSVDEAAQRRLAEYAQQDSAKLTQAEQAAVQRVQALEAALRQAIGGLDTAAQQKLVATEQSLGQRVQTTERTLGEKVAGVEQSLGQRLTAAEQGFGQRLAATEQGIAQKLTAAEQALGQKLAATEQAVTQRVGAVEQEQKRMSALEQRTAQLAAIDRIRSALGAGQPLGEALKPIVQPPAALARFATAAPPTESALRLSFEAAAASARAASDAAMRPDGSKLGVVDAAKARVGGLVTVRRGEQVVWGDAAEAEIERARKALDAGDIEQSLTYLDKLPPPAKKAMQTWVDQARALIAARTALRQLAAG